MIYCKVTDYKKIKEEQLETEFQTSSKIVQNSNNDRVNRRTATKKIRYAYNDNGQVISEANDLNQAIPNYVWGPDRLLSKRDAASNNRYYYLYNGHGDAVQIVDESGRNVNRYEYDEWGRLLEQEEEQEALVNPLGLK